MKVKKMKDSGDGEGDAITEEEGSEGEENGESEEDQNNGAENNSLGDSDLIESPEGISESPRKDAGVLVDDDIDSIKEHIRLNDEYNHNRLKSISKLVAEIPFQKR